MSDLKIDDIVIGQFAGPAVEVITETVRLQGVPNDIRFDFQHMIVAGRNVCRQIEMKLSFPMPVGATAAPTWSTAETESGPKSEIRRVNFDGGEIGIFRKGEGGFHLVFFDQQGHGTFSIPTEALAPLGEALWELSGLMPKKEPPEVIFAPMPGEVARAFILGAIRGGTIVGADEINWEGGSGTLTLNGWKCHYEIDQWYVLDGFASVISPANVRWSHYLFFDQYLTRDEFREVHKALGCPNWEEL